MDENIDFNTKIRTVVFLDSGDTSIPTTITEQILGNLTTTFMKMDYHIVERKRLESIISELALSFDDFFNESTAQEMGKMIGSDAIVMLQVSMQNIKPRIIKRAGNIRMLLFIMPHCRFSSLIQPL